MTKKGVQVQNPIGELLLPQSETRKIETRVQARKARNDWPEDIQILRSQGSSNQTKIPKLVSASRVR